MNIVKLLGICVEGENPMLVYEYLKNNSLEHVLHKRKNLRIDWPTRYKILLGVAQGFAYMHSYSEDEKFVHRDIKPGNVLLDRDMNAKISDFGIAKLKENHDSGSSGLAGSLGYFDPDYMEHREITDKIDVYCFGLVALEIVTRKTSHGFRPTDVRSLLKRFDKKLGPIYSSEQVRGTLDLIIRCLKEQRDLRPSMSEVVEILMSLPGQIDHHPNPSNTVSFGKTSIQKIQEYNDGASTSASASEIQEARD